MPPNANIPPYAQMLWSTSPPSIASPVPTTIEELLNLEKSVPASKEAVLYTDSVLLDLRPPKKGSYDPCHDFNMYFRNTTIVIPELSEAPLYFVGTDEEEEGPFLSFTTHEGVPVQLDQPRDTSGWRALLASVRAVLPPAGYYLTNRGSKVFVYASGQKQYKRSFSRDNYNFSLGSPSRVTHILTLYDTIDEALDSDDRVSILSPNFALVQGSKHILIRHKERAVGIVDDYGRAMLMPAADYCREELSQFMEVK